MPDRESWTEEVYETYWKEIMSKAFDDQEVNSLWHLCHSAGSPWLVRPLKKSNIKHFVTSKIKKLVNASWPSTNYSWWKPKRIETEWHSGSDDTLPACGLDRGLQSSSALASTCSSWLWVWLPEGAGWWRGLTPLAEGLGWGWSPHQAPPPRPGRGAWAGCGGTLLRDRY